MKRSPLKRTRRQMSGAEREFKDRFDEEVLAKRPIVFDPSKRRGIVDPHHVLPKAWLYAHTSTLEDGEAWAVVWDPDNGIPCDRGRHDDITVAYRRLEAAELAPFPEVVRFAERNDLIHLLCREVPTFDRGSLQRVLRTR